MNSQGISHVMTSEQGTRYSDLLRVTEALRNWKALGVLIGTGLAAGLLVFLGGVIGAQMGGFFIPALFAFLALLIIPVGISAAGLMLMDQAQGLPSRPLAVTLLDGVFAALKVLAVTLIGALVVLAFYIATALVLFLCKIPGLGPVLYALAFPVLVVVAGMLFFSLNVALSMVGPAIWSGAGIKSAVAMLWQIATHRMVELLISLFLLGLLLGLAGAVLGSILGVGYFSVLGLSLPILGNGMMASLGGFFGGFGGFGGVGGFGGFGGYGGQDGMGYMQAAGFGSLVILALVTGALSTMALMGSILIYLRVAADLDPSEAERLIGERLDEAKRKAQALKEESQRRAEEAQKRLRQQQEAAQQARAEAEARARAAEAAEAAEAARKAPVVEPVVEPVAEPGAAGASLARQCPQCKAAIEPGDRFCGECGYRLPG
ncbi:MAG: zinc ribbon domain-containing protein [Azovibrio sp.]|uniref:zinc ribbon domain-containing protein n=1 Tax=Azovibrio sp. TaxID=1872673 RepID=UPI003C7891E3